MIRAAFLGQQFVGQLSKRKPEGVDVVWVGTSPERFAAEVPSLKPTVVVLDLAEFADGADEQVRRLIISCNAELSIVTYSFARRQLIRSMQMQNQQVRVLQSPITLEVLQAHLAPFVIRQVLETGRKESFPMEHKAPPPRYNREQLGKLMEISSEIACECPSNLAQVVEKLQAFEQYSKDCENRNDKDKAVHTMLYRASTAARLEMEKALEELVIHEKLSV
jgi:hypothetical protein